MHLMVFSTSNLHVEMAETILQAIRSKHFGMVIFFSLGGGAIRSKHFGMVQEHEGHQVAVLDAGHWIHSQRV